MTRPSVCRRNLLIAVVILSACDAPHYVTSVAYDDRLTAWAPNPSTTILQTTQSKRIDPMLAVVSTLPVWQNLWNETWGGVDAAPPLPQLDFVLSSIIVVGTGKRAGLGYSVAIDSVVLHASGAVLFATEAQPGAHCDPALVSSSPVHMVHYPGHPPIVDWRVSVVRRDCGP